MQNSELPPLKPCATPQATLDEHIDALNQGDWARAMAQYPPEVEFFMAGGHLIQGRERIGELFKGFLRPRSQGGFAGIQFEILHAFAVGETINAQWQVTADFLAEPYVGSEAYAIKDGLIWSQVSTLRVEDMKFK